MKKLILIICALLLGARTLIAQQTDFPDSTQMPLRELQTQLDKLKKEHPEIEGIYELQLAKEVSTLHSYFSAGKLKHLQVGMGISVDFSIMVEDEYKFSKTIPGRGTYFITLLPDEHGKYTKFRLDNETTQQHGVAIRKSDFNDDKIDPALVSDCLSYFERHYKKSKYLIPMRDGTRLFTQVYSPIDQSAPNPILIMRTPYGVAPYGEEFRNRTGPSVYFAKENYILVFQDIRGRSMSEGTFRFVRPFIENKNSTSDVDESSDTYDTIEWLLENIPNNNGKVGVWGNSYPGFLAAMAGINAHPSIAAISPQSPIGDLFLGDDGHHSGALYLNHYSYWVYETMQTRGLPAPFSTNIFPFDTVDSYSFFLSMKTLRNINQVVFKNSNDVWIQMMNHELYDDYWKSLSVYSHLKNIHPAVLTVGGWYDAEDLSGTLKTYKTIEEQNPNTTNILVMGPWRHGGWSISGPFDEVMGEFMFHGSRAYFQEQVELPFFNYYLKGKGKMTLPEATIFETGSDKWRFYDHWPPSNAQKKKLFFMAENRISFNSSFSYTGGKYDEYISDPEKPVPYTQQKTTRVNINYFIEDQNFTVSRPDVVVYTSEPLAEDMIIAGPITAELYVSTTGTDADWIVKVIDVFPDNAGDVKHDSVNIYMLAYQRLIRGDVIRGKFRNSFETPESFIPGEVTKVVFDLPDVAHTFLKGHRVMIQVQSTWFPLIDLNPQKYCNIREANESDFKKANHRIYRTKKYPSGVWFWIL